jgi:hypothetical protein
MLNVIMLSVTNKPFILSVFILNVIMLSVAYKPFILSSFMLNVIMLSVVMLNVVAPLQHLKTVQLSESFYLQRPDLARVTTFL